MNACDAYPPPPHTHTRTSLRYCLKGSNRVSMFRTLSSQSTATIMWSYGALALRPSAHVLGELLHQSVRLVPEMSAQELCMFLDGMARIGAQPKRKMLLGINERARDLWRTPPAALQPGGGSSSSDETRGGGRGGGAGGGEGQTVADRVAAAFRGGSRTNVGADTDSTAEDTCSSDPGPQHCSPPPQAQAFEHTKVMVWACAKLGIYPPDDVEAAWTAGLAHAVQRGMTESELQVLVWNSTILNFDMSSSNGCLERHLASNAAQLSQNTLGRVIWSIAMNEALATEQSCTWDIVSAACARIEQVGCSAIMH